MKVKVINDKLEDFEKIFKVIRMNFDSVMVNYSDNNGAKGFYFKDVECISENYIDEFLINNRHFLKIKLKRGISVVFYSALYEALKSEIKEEITVLSVLKDRYKINKSKVWEKEILLLINNKFPLEVIASGRNFKRNEYNIIINKIEINNFLEICHVELKSIKEQIKIKKDLLINFEEAINIFENSLKQLIMP